MAIKSGGIYIVSDNKLSLPPNDGRKLKEARPFIVLTNYEFNVDDTWDLVLGCPISTSPNFVTKLCVQLTKEEASTPDDCWVRVPAFQPLLKTDLGAHMGDAPLPADSEGFRTPVPIESVHRFRSFRTPRRGLTSALL
jgi:mRNA-degrading endonuclease toxin of MazEF toxin-antitoxin module